MNNEPRTPEKFRIDNLIVVSGEGKAPVKYLALEMKVQGSTYGCLFLYNPLQPDKGERGTLELIFKKQIEGKVIVHYNGENHVEAINAIRGLDRITDTEKQLGIKNKVVKTKVIISNGNGKCEQVDI